MARGQRVIAVPTPAFARSGAVPVSSLGGPQGAAAFRPPGSHGKRAEGAAFVRPYALHELAEALGLFVYGGDVIVGKDGSMVVIDENDWPSFAVVRDLASEKIARVRQAGDEACRRLSPS
jgi:hypothetical protein